MARETIIRVADVVDAGYCLAGARTWFRLNGLDFKDFLRNGIPVSEIEHIDDGMARNVVARKEIKDGRLT